MQLFVPSATPACQLRRWWARLGPLPKPLFLLAWESWRKKHKSTGDFKNIPPRGVSGLIQRLCSSFCSISGGIWIDRAVWRYEDYCVNLGTFKNVYSGLVGWYSTLTPGLGDGLSLYGFTLLDRNFKEKNIYIYKKWFFFAADSFSFFFLASI